MFRIQIDGLDDLEHEWRGALRALSHDTGRAVETAATEGAAEARRVHAYKDRTGHLTRSTTGRLVTATLGGAEAEIVADAPYASFVENGTAPHDIWPKEGHGFVGPLFRGQSRRAKDDIGTHRVALRWYDGAGNVHFARMVHHPGSKPYPFMGPAYLKAERVLQRELEVAIARLVERMNR